MKKSKSIIIGWIIVCIFLFLLIILTFYNIALGPVSRNAKEEKVVEIQDGLSRPEIVKVLKENNLIRNEFVAKVYIKVNNINGLQAGKYKFNTGMSVKDILNSLQKGKVYNENIKITFVEGKNMRWFASKIAESTKNTEQDVYNLLKDKDYIESLISKYWFLTRDIQNESIYYPLEGYLFPDTYIFENENVSVKEIFNVILNNTDKILSKYNTQIQNSGYSVHQILTIGSIVELEGKSNTDRRGIARVIYNRLSKNMSLGSDVTAYYAIGVDMSERNLTSTEINTYNPYNTRGPNMSGKLPIGPIASVSEDSIVETLNPIKADYLYFVADMNGKIYFTKNYEEHKAMIYNLRKQGLWYKYDS